MNAIQAHVADVRHDPIECTNVPLETFSILMIVQVFDCRFLKRPCRSNAVDHGTANLFDAKS
jgi:hypothetical protein